MAGAIVLFSLMLIGWILLCVTSRNFRHDLYSDIGTTPRIDRRVFYRLTRRVLYFLWIGNVPELAENGTGREQHPVGKGHFMSAVFWFYLLLCIAGYASGYVNRDMGGFSGALVAGASLLYSDMKVFGMYRKRRDGEEEDREMA